MHISSRPFALAIGLATVVAATPFDLPPGFHRFAPRATNITWEACEGASNVTECGRFEVPLDYHNATAGKASLAVARYPATKQPKRGTLFLNPGGPGGSGVEMVLSADAESISKTAGGYYDIVSWDPRGVGKTYPRADCFATGTEEAAFWEGTIPHAGLEARGNFTEQMDINAFYEQVPEVDGLLIKLGQKCLEYSPDTFQYVGTAAVVRDLVALNDYLEAPDKPVNFWGFSYGTAVGLYLVNMFPDRVGRVIIDGVVDPFWAVSIESTDEAYNGFLQACIAAGPGSCALATKNSTVESLRTEIMGIINKAYDYKKAYGDKAEYGSSYIRQQIFGGMYGPEYWPFLAEKLVHFSEFLAHASATNPNNTKRALDFELARPRPLRRHPLMPRQASNESDPAPDYAFQAVTCADAVDAGNVTTQMVFDELVRATRQVSPMFGPIWGDAGFYCHHWPVRAVERYTGPWNKNLSNPILVIGNEADPITPYISAKRVADALGDSAILVEQDDYGHTSLAMHSSCTLSILTNYFLDNTLPSADQFCGTNQVLFPGKGITKSMLSVGGSGPSNLASSSSSSSNDLQSELNDARARANQLFIVVIALGAVAGFLLLSLIASCVFGRKKKNVQRSVRGVTFPIDAHDGDSHVCSTPYDRVKGEKGGYAPVST
ncbi:Abhydrolase domain-containing protein [Ceratobasidium sp. AG-Ba]|nr:Abhydrolase domain-containing protein [Ceratobasidium sp. AG-Ba]